MCAQDQQKGHLFFHFMMLIAIVKTFHLKKHKLDRNNTHNFRCINHDCASGARGVGGTGQAHNYAQNIVFPCWSWLQIDLVI